MRKLDSSEYGGILPYIHEKSCGAVYPYSVAEGIQAGNIYTDGDTVLVWHYCGFAFLYGKCERSAYERVYGQFLAKGSDLPRRFVLFVPDENALENFSGKAGIVAERRYFYTYGSGEPGDISIPAGYENRAIDRELLERIQGRITPAFSWESGKRFLQGGKGFCVTAGGEPAAWAFSAAVSGREIDIGVETCDAYQRQGLASAAVQAMVLYIRETGKQPVWACHAGNIASQRLAERSGFVRTGECLTVRADFT